MAWEKIVQVETHKCEWPSLSEMAAMASKNKSAKKEMHKCKYPTPSEMMAAMTPKNKRPESVSPNFQGFSPEIWSQILSDESLDLKDLKNARLACKMLAQIALEYLFKTFVFRRDRFDYQRLHNMMSYGRDQFAHDIRALRFEVGLMDPNHMARALAVTYRKSYGKVDSIDEYLAWFNNTLTRPLMHQKDWERLQHTVLKLEHLDRIDVVRNCSTFKEVKTWNAWVLEKSDNAIFNILNEEFYRLLNVMIAINKHRKEVPGMLHRKPVSHLSHDNIPVTFFTTTLFPDILDTFKEVAQHLETLHLSFESTVAPRKMFWNRLGLALTSCTGVKDLRLGFDSSFKNKSVDWSVCNQDSVLLLKYYVPLWKILPKNPWPKLEVLRLEGLAVCEAGLEHVLLGSPSSVRKLYLCQIALLHGSWQSLLGKFRKGMRLQDFEMWGHIMSIHGHREDWFVRQPKDLWKLSANSDAPGVRKHLIRIAKRWDETNSSRFAIGREALQYFVLRGGPWPNTTISSSVERPAQPNAANLLLRHIDCRRVNGICIQEIGIINFWWGLPEVNVSKWEKPRRKHRLHPDLATMAPKYDAHIYDSTGFNDLGYNRRGYAFTQIRNLRSATERQILNASEREILEKMIAARGSDPV
ncbi:hypothetical protein EG329_002019 [Mollisiaceae sp. DMI_Dod_QoI]|nr:hypothetical protein EG329_002019 [Helotiales sp. DMI_Dod_QoI]